MGCDKGLTTMRGWNVDKKPPTNLRGLTKTCDYEYLNNLRSDAFIFSNQFLLIFHRDILLQLHHHMLLDCFHRCILRGM